MKNAALLVRTPEPIDGEGILGYVLRLSESNGYETPWHVLRHAGYDQGEMRTAGFSVHKLAAIVGKDPALLQPLSYAAHAKCGRREYRLNGRFVGHSLTFRPFRLAKPAICPACVVEHGFAHVRWDASAYVACERHGTFLLTACPSCKSALSWFRPGLLNCKCGASLATVDGTQAPPATITLMRVLHSCIANAAAPASDSDLPMPFGRLAQMPLDSLLRLIAVLDKLCTNCVAIDSAALPSRSAADVFSDWPRGFHAFLRQLAASDPAPPQAVGLRKRFQSFYQAVFKPHVKIDCVDFLREEFVRFGADEWGEALVDGRLLRAAPASTRFVSANGLAARLKVMPSTARQMILKGAVPGRVVSVTGGRRYVADSSIVDDAVRDSSDRLEARVAGKFAGLPVSVLTELKRSGHYSTNRVANHLSGYWACDLAALSQRLIATAQGHFRHGLHGDARDDVVPLGKILSHWKLGSKHAKGAFVANVLEGKIVPIPSGCNSIEELRFRVTDVQGFRVHHALGSERDVLSACAAGTLAGCNTAAIAGLLASGHVRHAADGFRVSRASLEAFLEEWRPLIALARDLGTTSNGVLPLINASQVTLLRVQMANGKDALFVPIADAEALLIASSRSPVVLKRSANATDKKVDQTQAHHEAKEIVPLRNIPAVQDDPMPLPVPCAERTDGHVDETQTEHAKAPVRDSLRFKGSRILGARKIVEQVAANAANGQSHPGEKRRHEERESEREKRETRNRSGACRVDDFSSGNRARVE